MKAIYIPAYSKSKVNSSKISEISKNLPENIAIAYSIQYKKIAEEIKQILSSKHKITKTIQVLGCTIPVLPKEIQAVLLIGSGEFHAVSLALETGLPIYILDNNNFKRISEKDIASIKLRQKSSYLKFLNADNIGILVSTKPGQQNFKKAQTFKNSLKNKNPYLFIGDNINSKEFENFAQIQSWLNTACPRLDFDSSVMNINRINNFKD